MIKKPAVLERSAAGIHYLLTYKKVKNLNLRVHPDGSVAVSAPKRVSAAQVDEFVASRAQWIQKSVEQMQRRQMETTAANEYSDEECLRRFSEVSRRIYPLFASVLPQPPTIKVRGMKSRWGVCHVAKRYITLNKRLMDQPLEALEYVVLHEYVHFLYPNHQAGFHAVMAKLMPDYKQRRALLK